jgi:hypothetical protein
MEAPLDLTDRIQEALKGNPPQVTETENELIDTLRYLLDEMTEMEEDHHPGTGEEYGSYSYARIVCEKAERRRDKESEPSECKPLFRECPKCRRVVLMVFANHTPDPKDYGLCRASGRTTEECDEFAQESIRRFTP